MDYNQAVILALLQGLTEFLPISSSAHLILVPVILGWQDQGLAFDVAVHVGTLAAVVLYYRLELVAMIRDCLKVLKGASITAEARLAWYVLIGTIPVGLFGLFMPHSTELMLRSPLVIAATTIGFAILLWFAEKNAKQSKSGENLSWKLAVLIGAFQALALIPGTSRSGITITAGLLLGFKREFSARFSFLLSIPVIFLAGTLKGVELLQSTSDVDWRILIVGVLVSAMTAYLAIGLFLKLLERIGMLPFVVYRFLLGAVLIWVFV